jgi:hypothetical protein
MRIWATFCPSQVLANERRLSSGKGSREGCMLVKVQTVQPNQKGGWLASDPALLNNPFPLPRDQSWRIWALLTYVWLGSGEEQDPWFSAPWQGKSSRPATPNSDMSPAPTANKGSEPGAGWSVTSHMRSGEAIFALFWERDQSCQGVTTLARESGILTRHPLYSDPLACRLLLILARHGRCWQVQNILGLLLGEPKEGSGGG